MIAGVHTILTTYDTDAARAFFRDVLSLEAVDAGDGWLIFALPPGELACHPGAPLSGDQAQGATELYLLCKDIESARADLDAKGVEFVTGIVDRGYGLVTTLRVPGYGDLGLYEPRHPSPLPAFS